MTDPNRLAARLERVAVLTADQPWPGPQLPVGDELVQYLGAMVDAAGQVTFGQGAHEWPSLAELHALAAELRAP